MPGKSTVTANRSLSLTVDGPASEVARDASQEVCLSGLAWFLSSEGLDRLSSSVFVAMVNVNLDVSTMVLPML